MSDIKRPVLPTTVEGDCPTCMATWGTLDALLKSAETLPSGQDGQPGAQHVLDAIGIWWVGMAMAHAGGDPRPAIELLAQACLMNGVPVAVAQMNIGGMPSMTPGGNRAN